MKKIYVIPHAHWDREWYFSIEDSNLLLGFAMDRVVEVLENDETYRCFTYDGQSSVFDEYFRYYPEKRERIRKLVQERRLLAGPWYTQCDTVLVKTESIVRNLLFGIRGARKLGHSMNVGYLPDCFGQNGYLPSIFCDFDIGAVVVQRGLHNEDMEKGLDFYWKSPDGTRIPANNIYLGYGPGKFLSANEDYVKNNLLPMLDKLSAFGGSNLVLPAGGDQVVIRDQFPEVVRKLNEMNLGYEFILSNYEEFCSQLEPKGEVLGELITGEKSRIHATIGSQRVDMKLLNSRIEEKLYCQVEPLAVLYSMLGGEYPKTRLEEIFKCLFDCHAHDSIGGCNSDETNRAIMERLERIERILDGLINIMKKQIARGAGTGENIALAFNYLPKKLSTFLKFVLFAKDEKVVLEENGVKLEQSLLRRDYISGGTAVSVTAGGEVVREVPGYYRLEVLAKVDFDGLGYKAFDVLAGETDKISESDARVITNEFYEIELKDGRVSVKTKKRQVDDFITFENTADDGDSYDYSPKAGDSPTYSTEAVWQGTRVCDNLSEIEFSNEVKVAEKTQTIKTSMTLVKGSRRIAVKHTTLNESVDHRIRVLFPVESVSRKHYANQGYSLIERDNVNKHEKDWRELKFAEAALAIYPLEDFAGIAEKSGSFNVYARGLKEYEISGEHFALTLYRCVGLLGKDDLLWRPGRASGINNKVVETPDAQMLGKLAFEYGIVLDEVGDGLFDELELCQQWQNTYHRQTLNTFEERLERFELAQPKAMTNLDRERSVLTLEQVRINAIKMAEDSKKTIIRVFNPGSETCEIISNKKFERVNLLEEPVDLGKDLKPYRFGTIAIGGETE